MPPAVVALPHLIMLPNQQTFFALSSAGADRPRRRSARLTFGCGKSPQGNHIPPVDSASHKECCMSPCST